MKVSINPLEPKGSLPWVRFAPGNGWSIYDTQIKGCHCPKLEDAVNDYNRSIRRKVKALNVGKLLEGSEFDRLPVENCPGWGDAVRAEMVSRESTKAHEAGAKLRAEQIEAQRKLCGMRPPAGLLALLGMAAAMGALDGIFDDEDAPEVIEGENNPQVIKLLREAGIMKEIPGPLPGTVAGIVAIPRHLGEQFATDVEDAIRNGNPTALLVLLSGAGLVP